MSSTRTTTMTTLSWLLLVIAIIKVTIAVNEGSSYHRKLFNIEHYDLNDLPEGFIENMKYERNDTYQDPYFHEEWNGMMNEYHTYEDSYERQEYRQHMMNTFESRFLTERDLQLLDPQRCRGALDNPLRIWNARLVVGTAFLVELYVFVLGYGLI
jgi:hypothetical protein